MTEDGPRPGSGAPSQHAALATALAARGILFETCKGADLAARMVRMAERPGHLPVMLGGADDLGPLIDGILEPPQGVEAALAAVEGFDLAAWSRSTLEEMMPPEDDEDFAGEIAEDGSVHRREEIDVFGTRVSALVPHATWPVRASAPIDPVWSITLLHPADRARAEIALAAIPAEEPATFPAWLSFGGWNDCPMPAVHVAIHRRWTGLYGARITGMTHDVITCAVDRPPATREAAMALALEQFVYAPDIVDQGVGTVEALAASLLDAGGWYFWWD